ncbi:MAG: MFS transporter [bacterium]|nr:MFS transporter [bacterium]
MIETHTPRSLGPIASISERMLLRSGFLLTGVMAVVLGPLIPVLEEAWGIDHAQTGSLFLAQFTASSLGAIVSSINLRRSIVTGYALSAVSLFGLVLGGWPLARLFMAVSGFSLGLLISGSNLTVARWNPENRGAALSTLNLIWGIGAMISPLLFAVFADSLGAFGLLRLLGLLSVGASLALAFKLRNPAIADTTEDGGAHSAGPSVPMLSLVAALLFFYVGTEISIGGWLVALSDQFSAERSALSLIIGSGFWAAVLVGRAIAAIALRRLTETAVYSASLLVAGTGAVGLFLADSRAAVAGGALLAGLGLAALYPLTISILAAVTASGRSRFAGLIMACGGFGGAVLPWLTGRLSEASGEASAAVESSLSRGFLVPIAGLVVLAALFATYQTVRRASGWRPS